jgi:hypothetical protein
VFAFKHPLKAHVMRSDRALDCWWWKLILIKKIQIKNDKTGKTSAVKEVNIERVL